MMNSKKIIFILFIINIFIRTQVYAQPKIPKGKIPNEITVKVKENIENLYSRDPEVRQKAAVELRDMGEEAVDAIPFLEGMLDEKQYHLFNPITPGRFAAWALAEMGNKGFESLVNAIKSNNPIVRATAVSGLGCTKNPEALNYLLITLHDKNTEVRLSSITSIGALSSVTKDAKIKQGFIIALNDKDLGVQDTALFWIKENSEIIDDEMIQALILALKDFNREIRQQAADILEQKTGKKYKWKRWWD